MKEVQLPSCSLTNRVLANQQMLQDAAWSQVPNLTGRKYGLVAVHGEHGAPRSSIGLC